MGEAFFFRTGPESDEAAGISRPRGLNSQIAMSWAVAVGWVTEVRHTLAAIRPAE
jgi:hypothetical protein